MVGQCSYLQVNKAVKGKETSFLTKNETRGNVSVTCLIISSGKDEEGG